MKTKIAVVSMFCCFQLVGTAAAYAAGPAASAQVPPRKLAQADVDAAAAAGLESVYKIKARHSRSKPHGPRHPKKGKSRKHFAAGVSSKPEAQSEGNTCCASSPM